MIRQILQFVLFVASLMSLLSLELQGQLVIDNTQTPTQLVEDVLLGNGVVVSNVTFTGNALQAGAFTNTNSNLSLSEGIMLTTGFTEVAQTQTVYTSAGPTNFSDASSSTDGICFDGGICEPGDADLTALVGDQTYDAAVLEFDFVPLSDTIRFRYVFASEEYDEFTCSEYNDVFAFLLSGPGIAGVQNIALIPGTTLPVAINSVNSGVSDPFNGNPANCSGANGSLANSALYTSNAGGANLEFDGLTITLEAVAEVIPCEEYHIKLAIADAFDGAYDSGVFLEANSFTTDVLDVDVSTLFLNDTIIEGCDTATVFFTVSDPVTSPYVVNYTILGSSTATNGTDYPAIPASATIPIGSDSTGFFIVPFDDGLVEGTEFIQIEVQTSVCTFDTITLFIEEQTPLLPPIPACGTITDTSIEFTWPALAGASGYEISIDGGLTWISPNPGPLSHVVSGLSPGTAVTFQVRGINIASICDPNPDGQITCTTTNSACFLDGFILTQTDASCFGVADGSVTVIDTGGVGSVMYIIDGGAAQTSPTFGGLSQGTYQVVVQDSNNCTDTIPVTIGSPSEVILNLINSNPPGCNAGATGSYDVNASGGTGPYSYSDGVSTNTTGLFSGLNGGVYTVVATDNSGCSDTLQVNLVDPLVLTIQTTSTNVSCNGGSDGTAGVNILGGTAPFTYNWNTIPVQTTQSVSGLSPGVYQVTVSDSNGCTLTGNSTITEPTAITTTETTVDVRCFGETNGIASITANGGTQPYTYAWSTGSSTTFTETGLAAGNYTYTVTDANGCTFIDDLDINSPSQITTSVTTTAASCFGVTDGSATVTPGGGAGGYTYDWSDGQTTQTATNLAGGFVYYVFVTDASGCIVQDSILVPSPPEIVATIDGQNPACNNGSDGFVGVEASGGTGSLTYLWNAAAGNATTDTVFNVGAGNYEVTVSDAIGCSVILDISITEPAPIGANFSVVNVLCKGEATGQAVVTGNGGIGEPYTYQWDANTGNQQGDTAVGLVAGTYFVTITDTLSCQSVESVLILEPAEYLDGVTEIEDITCFEGTDGSVTYTVFGGVPPYMYSIDSLTFGPENAFVGLTGGDYTVYAVDNNGCVIQETVTLQQPQELIVDIQIGTDTIILGDSTQLIASVNRPQTDSIAYAWTFNPTGGLSCINCPNPYTAQQDHATYIVTATDESGCFDMDTVTIYIDKNRVVYVANAFTPNSDNINDALFVQTGTGVAQVDRFIIYDRWGELVFESADTQPNDPSVGWDGTFKGKEMNQAVFAWYAEVTFIDGYKVILKGEVQLLR